MTDAEIKTAMRRGIYEPRAVKVSAALLTTTVAHAVTQLGLLLKKYAPDSLKSRKTINSTTHVFDYPSDCDVLLNLWDLDTNAGTITGATAATPIVITEVAHGRSTNDIVTIHDIVGNTVANGTFKITKIDADTYSLNGTVGTAAWTSGGKAFEETTDFVKMDRIPESDSTLDDDSEYFLRNNQIVVDDIDFTNDLLITYIHSVSGITDIPAKYHLGIVAFGVMHLMDMPDPEDKKFAPKKTSLDFYGGLWNRTVEDILHGSQITVKSSGVSKMKHI
jgi:hypothetical protein